MFGRLRDLFDDWHRECPQYVAKLGFSKFKRLVRTRHWYIRSVQRENCCCLPCENHGMTRKPMMKAAETMEKLVAQMEADEESCDANADVDGDTASAKEKEKMLSGLKDLIKLCRMKHKLDQMQFILCDPVTPDCLDDKCEQCGFKRLWSNGLRSLIVDGNELKSTPAGSAFGSTELKLEKYVKISAESKKDYSKQADAKEDNSGDYGKKDGAKKRLDTEASNVNLAELLDYFETICPGMCKHRHTLKECKEAAQELFRNAPLGYFLLDKDFAENFLIIAARLIQSQYWSQISATLYIVVLRWLCAKTWHDMTTTLKPGDEVTVDAPAAGSTPFWARVQLALDGDVYRLECADGKVVEVERSCMHQRKWLSHALPCFSDDMRHDSFLAQHLDNNVLEYIKTEIIDVAHTDVAEPSEWMDEHVFRSTSIRVAAGDEVTVQPGNGQEAFRATVVELKQGGKVTVEDKFGQKTEHRRELLRKIEYKVVICMHSDNASQHFKTVKALHWLSHLKERFPWLRTVRWCFGCPGHGKGPWDGIGAVIKSLLRRAITDSTCANAAGKISTAEHCYEHIRATLCGPSWHPGRGAAISKFVTFYATNHDVDSQTRHVNRYELSQCPGIMSSYSYFALETDVVLQRRFDCNCHVCLRVTRPHEDESVDPMIDRDGKYVIRGCLRGADSFHDFEDRCVRRLDHQAEQALRKASEKVGNELAKEWNAKQIGAGQYLLVQNSDPTADGHQLWCCRTVDCTQYKPRSADMGMDYGGCVLHIAREKTKMPNSVGLAVGEHAITVQWCERDPSAADDRKLTFVYDPTAEVTVINASEIRFELSGADAPKVLAAPKRVTRPRPQQSHVAAVRPNAQQLQQAEAQRKAAQTVFSVHTRSELEALKLCHHMTL